MAPLQASAPGAVPAVGFTAALRPTGVNRGMSSLATFLPSPTRSAVFLGPLPIRGYALCIIAGILLGLLIGTRRWRARGGRDGGIGDVSMWAIAFGLVGGRLYHVISDPELYFTAGRNPWNAFKIWDGGLGIWGAIALGGLGAWIGCRRHGIALGGYADVVIPGVAVAQALGRWGNWFNNELYGSPSTLPWALQIHSIDIATGRPAADAAGHPIVLGYFQPTFLYECLWDLALAAALVLIDRKFRPGNGKLFWMYVMGYTAGRGWIEALRTDHANHILGLRLNDWTSLLVFLGAALWLWLHRGPGTRELYPADAGADAGTTDHGRAPQISHSSHP